MRLFFSKHELKLRRKRNIAAIICVVIVLGAYWILTRPQKVEPEMPTVIVEPVVKDDVEIYGEYVGRIRAQQFVEVRARVEGYLENMLFAEGTYVNKNQVLFVINQDQYRAKADKARAHNIFNPTILSYNNILIYYINTTLFQFEELGEYQYHIYL